MDGQPERLRLTARSLPELHADSGLFTIVLHGSGVTHDPVEDGESGTLAEQPAIEQLESDLCSARATVPSAMQDLESVNDVDASNRASREATAAAAKSS